MKHPKHTPPPVPEVPAPVEPYPPAVFEFQTVSDFIKAHLAHRQAKNPRYSLRTFAVNYLGISPSMASLVISGRRKLSMNQVLKLAQKLKFSGEEKNYLILLSLLEQTPHLSHQQIKNALQAFKPNEVIPFSAEKDVEILMFPVFSWLLEVFRLNKNKTGNLEWLASQLVLFKDKKLLQNTLDFLVQKDIIQYDARTKIYSCKSRDVLLIKSKFHNDAIRNYIKFMMDAAAQATDELPTLQNRNMFLTFAFEQKDWATINMEIQKNLFNIRKKYSATENPDQVCQINLHAFTVAPTEQE